MATIKNIIDEYLNKGFGSMNKNDFEVWIFNYLLQNGLNTESNYAISKKLRIPEPKVKRLRYEADLKYANNNDEAMFNDLNTLLKRSHIKQQGERIQFVIEDISLRKFLDNRLKRLGRFADSSFNSEIVSLDVDDLEALYCSFEIGEQLMKQIMTEVRKKPKQNNLTFRDVVKILATKLTEKACDKIVDLSLTGILELIKNLL